jgi:hypothetical protein
MTTATESAAALPANPVVLKYLRGLQQTYFAKAVRGYPLVAWVEQIESDKRSQARVVRELIAAGYLAQPTVPGEGGDKHYALTPAVVAEIPAVCPDLTTMGANSSNCGVAFDSLSLQQQKYVLANAGQYTATWSNGFKTVPATIGQAQPKEVAVAGYGWSLYVADAEFTGKRQADERAKKIEQLFRANLPHALVNFAAIEKSDAEGWSVKSSKEDGFPLFGSSSVSRALGPDVATWDADAQAIVKRAQDRVTKAMEEMASVLRVVTAVQQVGGWQKVAESLRETVTEHVDRPASEPSTESK